VSAFSTHDRGLPRLETFPFTGLVPSFSLHVSEACRFSVTARKFPMPPFGRLLALLSVLALVSVPWAETGDQRAAGKQAPDKPKPISTDRFGDPLPSGALARLGTVRLRAVGGRALVFAKDGKTLISAAGHRIGIWDLRTGKPLRVVKIGSLNDEHNHPHCLQLSADGKDLALGSQDGIIVVWQVETGKAVHRIRAGKDIIASLAFSPDGKVLASREFPNRSIRFWELATGRQLRSFGNRQPNSNDISCSYDPDNFTFSPDGKLLAAADEDGTVRIWEAATGKELFHKREKSGAIFSLAFAPDGKVLAWGDKAQTICLWDMARRKEVHRLKSCEFGIRFLTFSPDSWTLVSGEYDGSIRFWDTLSGKEIRRLEEQPFMVSCVTFSPDGKTLAAIIGNAIRSWDVATGRERPSWGGHTGYVYSVAFSPDGRTIASGSVDETVRLWDKATGREVRQFARDCNRVLSLAFAHKGKTLLAETSGHIRQWSAETGTELRGYGNEPESELISMALGEGGRVLLSFGKDYCVRRWEMATGKEQPSFEPRQRNQEVDVALLSPSGRTAALVYRDRTVHFWDVTTGKGPRRFSVPWERVASGTFSPDGKTLALVGALAPKLRIGKGPVDAKRPALLSLWEVATADLRLHWNSFKDEDACLGFSPDGRTLASAGVQSGICLWEVSTGKRFRRFWGNQGHIYSLAFSPDGAVLASAGEDSTVLLWDLKGPAGKPPATRAVRLTERELEFLWQGMGGKNASRAYRAMGLLAGAPAATVSFFKDRLRPVPEIDPRLQKRIDRLVEELDSERFAVRRRAARELAKLGDVAGPAVRKLLAGKPSLEVRRRAEKLHKSLMHWSLPGDELRALRCIEVLEQIGTRQARQILEKLADGATEAWITEDARGAL
jgi:WD40 repeat protein